MKCGTNCDSASLQLTLVVKLYSCVCMCLPHPARLRVNVHIRNKYDKIYPALAAITVLRSGSLGFCSRPSCRRLRFIRYAGLKYLSLAYFSPKT